MTRQSSSCYDFHDNMRCNNKRHYLVISNAAAALIRGRRRHEKCFSIHERKKAIIATANKSAEGLILLSMKFYVYITTNPNQDALYVGMTNNLEQRIIEHYLNRGKPETYAGKYYCYNLVFYEEYKYVNTAIAREKEIKKMATGKERNTY